MQNKTIHNSPVTLSYILKFAVPTIATSVFVSLNLIGARSLSDIIFPKYQRCYYYSEG